LYAFTNLNMVFETIIEELKANIDRNKSVIESNIKKNPSLAFTKINELARFVGQRYNMDIRLHFPDKRKMREISSIGTENIGIVIDSTRKRFPISRQEIKSKAEALLADFIEVRDAYMYENKEGIRVVLKSGRLEIQPGSLLIWCKVNRQIMNYVEWLMKHVYFAEQI
jgi:hypothetical protein